MRLEYGEVLNYLFSRIVDIEPKEILAFLDKTPEDYLIEYKLGKL